MILTIRRNPPSSSEPEVVGGYLYTGAATVQLSRERANKYVRRRRMRGRDTEGHKWRTEVANRNRTDARPIGGSGKRNFEEEEEDFLEDESVSEDQ